MTERQLTKAVGVVAVFTVVGKVLGFLRETSLAAVFGATAATDAFLVSQTVPLLLFATVSYALSTTFIPAYSKVLEERGELGGHRFASTVLWAVFPVAVVFTVVGQAFAENLVSFIAPGFDEPQIALTAYLTRILFPLLIFNVMSGIMTGMLQVDGRFGKTAVAGHVQSLAIIVAIVFFGRRFGIAAVAVGTVVGAVLTATVNLGALMKSGFRWKMVFDFRDPALHRVIALMAPAVLIAGADQLNVIIDRVLASGLPEGRLAALSYANRLVQLVPGIVGASIVTVAYPTLSRMSAVKQWHGYADRLVGALSLMHFLLAPIAVGSLILREPLVRLVYERGAFDSVATKETAWAFLFLSLGIATRSMRDLVSRAFFTVQDTLTPVLIALASIGLNIALNFLLIGPLAQGGLALGTVLASLAGLVLGLWVFGRKFPVRLPVGRLRKSVSKTLLASGLMGLVVWAAYPFLVGLPLLGKTGDLGGVLLSTGLGGVVYGTIVYALKVPEVAVVASATRGGLQAVQRLISRGGRRNTGDYGQG